MKVLKLFQYHYLFHILIYQVSKNTTLHLKCYIETLYIDVIKK